MACPSLHLSKCQIVGNLMPRLKLYKASTSSNNTGHILQDFEHKTMFINSESNV